MKSRPPLLVWLTVVWVALWEDVSLANVVGGLLVGGVLLLAFRSKYRGGPAFTLRPVAAVVFVGYFVRRMIVANVLVTKQVLTPGRQDSEEGIIAVPVRFTGDSVLALLANAISLVPGTLILEITRNPTVLYIHLLHVRSVERELLDVYRLERQIARAFGTRESIDDVEAHIAELERELAGRPGGAE